MALSGLPSIRSPALLYGPNIQPALGSWKTGRLGAEWSLNQEFGADLVSRSHFAHGVIHSTGDSNHSLDSEKAQL